MNTTEAGATTRRRRWTVTATAATAAAGTTAFWWGNPHIGPGSTTGPGQGMSWASDGLTETRMLIKGTHPATVTATFSIRNDGHLPFTLHGLDVDTVPWLSQQKVTFVPAFPFTETTTPANQTTLAPGDETAVQWSLTFTCQPAIAEGGYTSLDHLRFTTSWLGLTTTRDLPLERPITITSDSHVPGLPAC